MLNPVVTCFNLNHPIFFVVLGNTNIALMKENVYYKVEKEDSS
jgi:hypothetical protein